MNKSFYRLRTPEGEETTYTEFGWYSSFALIWFFGFLTGIILTILFYL